MSEVRVRGVRGAISVETNEPAAILEATRSLLEAILRENQLEATEDISSIFFTATSDLDATFPAEAARQLGMQRVPLLCASEMPVPGSLPGIVRVLLHWNTTRRQDEIVHVYLGRAVALRRDLTSAQ
jgi:chorismate mutase